MATINYEGIVGQLRDQGRRVQCGLRQTAGNICGAIIKNERKNLRDHVNQHHRAGSSYKRRHVAQPGVKYYCDCTLPYRTFDTFGGLDYHMRYAHDFRGPAGHIENDPGRTVSSDWSLYYLICHAELTLKQAFVTNNRVTNRVPAVSSVNNDDNNDHAHAHEEENEEEEEE